MILRCGTPPPCQSLAAPGETPTASEASLDVGGDARSAAKGRAPILHAAESDPGYSGPRHLRRVALPAVLHRRHWAFGSAARPLLRDAVARVLRRALPSRHRVADSRFVGLAERSAVSVPRASPRSVDGLP